MSQGPLCPNFTQKVQKEVSQMSNRNFPIGMLLGGLSVNLNHLKITRTAISQKLVNRIKKKNCSSELHIFTPLSQFLAQISKYPSLQKSSKFFDIWAIGT